MARVCVVGGVWQGVCMEGGMHGRRDGHCSGQYASYWNAFLFIFVFQPVNVTLVQKKYALSHKIMVVVQLTFNQLS